MKKKYTSPPEAKILRFDGEDVCAASPEDGASSWGDGRFEFPMIPL